MNEICRRLWDRDLTIAKWSEINGFNPRYVQVVLAGSRGTWNVGKAKKIKLALINQGFMTRAEAGLNEAA